MDESLKRSANGRFRRSAEAKVRRMERLRRIRAMADEGFGKDEISAVVGMTANAMHRELRQSGFLGMARPGHRRMATFVRVQAVTTLRKLAGEAETSVPDMIRRILHAVAADDGRLARRILGKEALPKGRRRRYPAEERQS